MLEECDPGMSERVVTTQQDQRTLVTDICTQPPECDTEKCLDEDLLRSAEAIEDQYPFAIKERV